MNRPETTRPLGGLARTRHREMVVACLEESDQALRADEIMDRLDRAGRMNKVTLYRILDKLVEKGVVLRVSSADRSFRYCLGRGANRRGHCHFYCRVCGSMRCLPVDSAGVDLLANAEIPAPGHVERVEIRLDGICAKCAAST